MSRVSVVWAAVVVGVLARQGRASAQGAELPPLQPQATENVSLIANGGFEDPGSPAWRLSDWPPRPETGADLIADSVLYSQDQVRSGEWALRIDLTTVEEDRNLLAQQTFSAEVLAPHDGRRVRMSAWVWLESGPPGYQGTLSIRQWGPPGAPPIGHASVEMPALQAEWVEASTEFTLRVGETTRGDITVGARQVSDIATAPLLYVDDVKLEVIQEPPLAALALTGQTLMKPDNVLPLKVELSDQAWEDGLRYLRWNVTSPDGLRAFGEGDLELTERHAVVEPAVPDIPEGRYAVRLAIGDSPGGRTCETLVHFRRAEGPFAR
jgi:hypothetical protein